MAGSVGQTTQGWLPFMGEKSKVGAWTRNNVTVSLGMGYYSSDGTQNNELTWDVWLDSGTWKLAQVHTASTNVGIYTWQLNGVSIGTIDGYAGSAAHNTYSEITGISVTTPALYTLKLLMATKNASSSSYSTNLASVALIKTAGAHSTPSGTDTPGYTWMYLPWMGVKSSVGTWARVQSSSYLGGGIWGGGAVTQNDEYTMDVWLDAGTYKFCLVHYQDADRGITTIYLDGASQGTIDSYAASAGSLAGTYSEITGITVATAGVKTLKLAVPTKNASSTNYRMNHYSLAWIRTA